MGKKRVVGNKQEAQILAELYRPRARVIRITVQDIGDGRGGWQSKAVLFSKPSVRLHEHLSEASYLEALLR